MKRIALLIIAFLVVLASVLYTNRLATQLSIEEQKRMEIWAEATRQFILAQPGEDIDFISTIIEGNTTIPVFMTDEDGRYMLSRNVDIPRRLQKEGMEQELQAYYQKQVDKLRESTTPIEVRLSEDLVQYIYYDQSRTLARLHLLPYVQFVLIIAFILIGIISLSATHRAEANRLWVGLSKETAHQLGTPISSLNGWLAILRAQDSEQQNASTYDEIDRDLHRLTTITERFSKIGSRPELTLANLQPTVEDAVQYMKTRTSSRIQYTFVNEAQAGNTMLNIPLFTWVIENLIRNAVDAMNGEGQIDIRISEDTSRYYVDISDTGKGIERRRWRQVFNPGYTTKQRGWGLGLSLAKRIISDYHHGRIYVLTSEIGKGTTFRIMLKKAV